jgi:two-component system response regulator AtoC
VAIRSIDVARTTVAGSEKTQREASVTKNGKILPLRLDLDNLPEEGGGVTSVLIGSKAMREAHLLASQVACSDAPVLLQGESGTGKELFARLIHAMSNRSEKPFVPVNCAVLKGELFADKFFGHEAGAFTGAARQQRGSFELAGNGTLFLDEVGDIPPHNQADFLRVLEQRTFRRLGGEKDLPFEARIVAATNRNLREMVRQGEFRADLYYRLNVVPVALPALRQRREDIPVLAGHFLEMFARQYHKQGMSLSAGCLEVLAAHSWPGNVRELRNLIERLVLVNSLGEIGTGGLPAEMRHGGTHQTEEGLPEDMSLDAAVRDAEIKAIFRAYAHAGGNKSETARLLGISPRTLRHKVQEYALKLSRSNW